ncbi:MAG: hypothetical protein Q4F71_12305 [Paracoccus sp. (in: a-proteobacteria)]|nr:hypothetical protein [Paracoccus sp. (in: a-proteobacteria)]
MRVLICAAMLLSGLAIGVAAERYLAADACLDLGGTMHAGVCRGVDV